MLTRDAIKKIIIQNTFLHFNFAYKTWNKIHIEFMTAKTINQNRTLSIKIRSQVSNT